MPTDSSRRSSRHRSSRSSSRPRTSARRRCSCTAATTCASVYQAGSAALRLLAIVIAAPVGVTEALVAIVVAQAISTIVISVDRRRRAAAVPGRAARGARRGRPGDPHVRPAVEHRDGRHLAAHDARPADPRRRLGHDAGRPLPHRDRRPQTGLAAASSPARLVLLTEQTRDWEQGERARACSPGSAATRSGRARSWSSPCRSSSSRCPGSSGSSSARSTTAPSTAARIVLHRRGDPLRARLDEVAARHDRPAAPADRHARARDARRDPARRAARRRVGCDRSGGGGPRLDARVRSRLAGRDRAPARRGARRRGAGGAASSREGRRRVRDLAARSRRPGEPCSGARRLPRGARARRRGRDDRGLRSRRAAPYPVRWAPRRSPLATCSGPRLLVRRAARRADVVYATSMIRRAAIGSRLARRPLVVKLVSDEVFERATRSGRYAGTLDAFQRDGRRAHPLPAGDATRPP